MLQSCLKSTDLVRYINNLDFNQSMQEKLFFENTKGNKLCGILANPTSDKEKPVMILCHGFNTSKDSYTNVRLEKILSEQGISTFRFDFFAHGESEGTLEEITISEAIDDVLNAVRFLKELGYSKIGLVGSSFGGMASVIAASKTDDLLILALKSPVSGHLGKLVAQEAKQQIKTWKEKGFIYYTSSEERKIKLDYSFFEDAEKANGYEAAQKIKIPTVIVHGDKDESIPVEQSKKLAGLIKSSNLEIIEGADHRYSKPEDFEKMLDFISKFIIEETKSSSGEEGDTMSTEENKAIVRQFLGEAYGKKKLAVGDKWLAANPVLHTPGLDMEGREAWKRYATMFLTAFPDLDIAVDETIAEGDKVVACWTARGTHKGDLQGIAPTGKQVRWTGIAIYRFAGGKIEEIWGWNDKFGMMQQLGVIPTPGQAGG